MGKAGFGRLSWFQELFGASGMASLAFLLTMIEGVSMFRDVTFGKSDESAKRRHPRLYTLIHSQPRISGAGLRGRAHQEVLLGWKTLPLLSRMTSVWFRRYRYSEVCQILPVVQFSTNAQEYAAILSGGNSSFNFLKAASALSRPKVRSTIGAGYFGAGFPGASHGLCR